MSADFFWSGYCLAAKKEVWWYGPPVDMTFGSTRGMNGCVTMRLPCPLPAVEHGSHARKLKCVITAASETLSNLHDCWKEAG